MPRPKAVLDASVLFQEPIRSLLLWIANQGAYSPFWTERILTETRDSLLRKGVVTSKQWIGLRDAINQRHFPPSDLVGVGKRSLDADGFLCELISRSPYLVHDALILQVAHMRNPRPWTLAELAGRLKGQGPGDPLAPAFAGELEKRFAIKPLTPPSL